MAALFFCEKNENIKKTKLHKIYRVAQLLQKQSGARSYFGHGRRGGLWDNICGERAQ